MKRIKYSFAPVRLILFSDLKKERGQTYYRMLAAFAANIL